MVCSSQFTERNVVRMMLALMSAVVLACAIWAGVLRSTTQRIAGVKVLDMESGVQAVVDLDRSFDGWPIALAGSARRSGYPAEVCMWNDCAARGGTWVVLNEVVGRSGPTRCPRCGQRVVAHNPRPGVESDEQPTPTFEPHHRRARQPLRNRGDRR